MRMKDVRRQLAAKGVSAVRTLDGWLTLVPREEVYFVDRSGTIRRHDVKAAGGRRAYRQAKREKRRRAP